MITNIQAQKAEIASMFSKIQV